MDKLPKDVVALLAIDLDYVDILKLCRSSSRMNRFLCQNEDFWRNKLYKTYPFARKLQEKFPITNFRKFYGDVEREIKSVTVIPEDRERRAGGFDMPSFIRPELRNFFMYADFGVIPNTEVPLNYILWPIVQKGIMSRALTTKLLVLHMMPKHRFVDDDGKKYFRASPEMELYLNKYLEELELKERGRPKLAFSRHKFVFNRLQAIVNSGFLPQTKLTKPELQSYYSLTKNISDKVDKIFDKIRNSMPN